MVDRPLSPVPHTSRYAIWLFVFGLFSGCGQPSDRPSMQQMAHVEDTEKPTPVEVACATPPLISAKDTGNDFRAENPPTHDAGANVGKAPWNDCKAHTGGAESPEALMRLLLAASAEPLDNHRARVESLMPDGCTYFAATGEFDDFRRADILMMKADFRKDAVLAEGLAAAAVLRSGHADFATLPIERVLAPWCGVSDEKDAVPCITWTRIRTPDTTLQMQAIALQDRWYPLTALVVPMPFEAVESWVKEHTEAVLGAENQGPAMALRADKHRLSRLAVEQMRLEAHLVTMSRDEVARVDERVSQSRDFIRKLEAATPVTTVLDTPASGAPSDLPEAGFDTAGITKVDVHSYEIDSTRLDHDEVRLAFQTGARVVPHAIGGDIKAMKLVGIRPGSIYRALGIRSGDVLTAIDGAPITPKTVERLFTLPVTRGEHRIRIERRGTDVELVWTTK
jgi:hypothetical protein